MASTVILTGGIGSGKSVVAAILASRGIPVYDSDSRTKALYDSNPTLIPSLEQALGTSLRADDGKLDRKLLASIIFDSPERREQLESIVYPLVFKDFQAWKEEHSSAPFVVLESAVILSKPQYFPIADAAVVLVKADSDVRARRTMQRDGATLEAAMARMKAQPDVPETLARAVIDNSGTLEELQAQVERVFFK